MPQAIRALDGAVGYVWASGRGLLIAQQSCTRLWISAPDPPLSRTGRDLATTCSAVGHDHRNQRSGFAAWFGAFEEGPRMSSQRDACRRKADEAKQRAAHATEPFMKSAYEKVAEHWMLLARLESLVAAEKESPGRAG